jgi:hypothetical protein
MRVKGLTNVRQIDPLRFLLFPVGLAECFPRCTPFISLGGCCHVLINEGCPKIASWEQGEHAGQSAARNDFLTGESLPPITQTENSMGLFSATPGLGHERASRSNL